MTGRRLLTPATLGPLVLGLVLAVFALGPLAALVLRSVLLDRASMWAEVTTSASLTALLGTLQVALGAAFLALVVGTPLSLLAYRTDLPGRHALTTLLTLPTAVPPFIVAMGWITLANPTNGLLNRLLDTLGLPLLNAYSGACIALVQGTAGLPLVVLAGGAALKRLDPALEEAARLSGAGPLRTLRDVTFPLVLPSLLSAAGLVFLATSAAFGVPYVLGTSATPPVPVLTTRIYGLLQVGGDATTAGAMGLGTVLLSLAALAQWLSLKAGERGRVKLLSGKGVADRPIALGQYRRGLAVFAWGLASMLVVLPLAAVFLASVQARPGGPLLDWTVEHWGALLGAARVRTAFAWSLGLSTGAAVLACGFGLFSAVLRHRAGRWGRLVDTMVTWPYAVPGTVLALALLLAFSLEWRFVAFDSVAFVFTLASGPALLLVAYVAKETSLGTRTVGEALAQADGSLEEAARLSGAGPFRAFRDATFPTLWPALTTTFVLAFLTCASELTMSVLLVPPGMDLIGTLLFELQSYADPAGAAVLASAFVLVVVGVLGLGALVRGRTGGAR